MDFIQEWNRIRRKNLERRDDIELADSIVVGMCSSVSGLCYKLINLNLATKDEKIHIQK